MEALCTTGPFALLLQLMRLPEETLQRLRQAALRSAMSWLHMSCIKQDCLPSLHAELAGMLPKTEYQALSAGEERHVFGGLMKGLETGSAPVASAGICPSGALASKERLTGKLAVHLCLDDAEAVQTKEFEHI